LPQKIKYQHAPAVRPPGSCLKKNKILACPCGSSPQGLDSKNKIPACPCGSSPQGLASKKIKYRHAPAVRLPQNENVKLNAQSTK